MTLSELSAKISGAIAGKVKLLLDGKVDKIAGKGLSTEDYSAEEKATLAAVKALLQNAVLDRTASGNPATFSDAKAANVKALSVTITPTQSGSGDPSPDNVRPITGVSSVTATRTGKNLLENPANGQTIIKNGVTFTHAADGTITANGTASSAVYYKVNDFGYKSGVSYILSGCPSGGSMSTYYAYNGKAADNHYDFGNGTAPFDGSSTTKPTGSSSEGSSYYIFIYSGFTASNLVFRPMIRLADTDATFEPYRGQTVTVSLTDGANPLTVYGGTLDVTTGALAVTWVNIASYNGETLPGRWISDRDVYAPGTTPTTGAQVVYELATPATYQLTPQQLATLAGYNAVSSDAGVVEVTYKADASIIWGGD